MLADEGGFLEQELHNLTAELLGVGRSCLVVSSLTCSIPGTCNSFSLPLTVT